MFTVFFLYLHPTAEVVTQIATVHRISAHTASTAKEVDLKVGGDIFDHVPGTIYRVHSSAAGSIAEKAKDHPLLYVGSMLIVPSSQELAIAHSIIVR